MVVILLLLGQIPRAASTARRPQLDIIGVAPLGERSGPDGVRDPAQQRVGVRQPRTPPTIDGTEITPLGFSPVPFLVLGGLALLGAFVLWQQRRARLGRDQLLDTTLLRVPQLRAGLSTLLGQQLVLMGTFFVIPVYLQVVLGLDAFETGKRLLPLSLAMLVFALLGPRIAARRSPRTVAQLGLVAVSIGSIVMLATLDVTLNDPGFKVALAAHRGGRRIARIAAGERDHVVRRAREVQRGGRAPGHRPEPRLIARHGDHRRGAACIARDRLQPARCRQPGHPGGRARDDRRESPGGNRHRARGRCRAGRDRWRAHAGPGRLPLPPTTATRSSKRCGSLSVRLRSPHCCRSGSHDTCRRALSPRARARPGAGGRGSLGRRPALPGERGRQAAQARRRDREEGQERVAARNGLQGGPAARRPPGPVRAGRSAGSHRSARIGRGPRRRVLQRVRVRSRGAQHHHRERESHQPAPASTASRIFPSSSAARWPRPMASSPGRKTPW